MGKSIWSPSMFHCDHMYIRFLMPQTSLIKILVLKIVIKHLCPKYFCIRYTTNVAYTSANMHCD